MLRINIPVCFKILMYLSYSNVEKVLLYNHHNHFVFSYACTEKYRLVSVHLETSIYISMCLCICTMLLALHFLYV